MDADFAVVGAGLAGLVAARDLVAAGSSVVVLEARSRVGGRTLSEHLDQGVTIDLGGQWVGPYHDHLRDLGKSLDLARTTYGPEVDAPGLLTLGARRFPMRGMLPDVGVASRLDLLQAGIRLSRMVRKVPVEAAWTARSAQAWDAINASVWMHRRLRTADGRAVARAMTEVCFAFEPEETSLLGLLFDIRASRNLHDLWGAQADGFVDGAQQLAICLAAQGGCSVLLDHAVRRIVQRPGGCEVEAGPTRLRCRRVAVCIPPKLARGIEFDPPLPAQRYRLLEHLPPGDAIKILVVYDRPFWRDRGHSGMSLNTRGCLGITYDTTPRGFAGGILLALAVASGAKRLRAADPDEQRRVVLSEVDDLFGPATPPAESVHLLDWSREAFTGGCYAAHFVPRAWTEASFSLAEPCGLIYWGGTETATEWHGYLEGAVRSGKRVAAEMLAAS